MYVLARQMMGLPVFSLQTGQTIATVASPILEPTQLEVVALRCNDQKNVDQPVIMPVDVRQISSDGLIVDSEEALTDGADVVRLAPLLSSGSFPIGVAVVSDLGRKLGKVEEYTINLETYRLQKLHIKPALVQSLLSGSLIIDRSQIIDVKPNLITVRDVAVKASVASPKAVVD